jgi:hypothetical protein
MERILRLLVAVLNSGRAVDVKVLVWLVLIAILANGWIHVQVIFLDNGLFGYP